MMPVEREVVMPVAYGVRGTPKLARLLQNQCTTPRILHFFFRLAA
jgi:hypothetical protein